MKIEDISRRIIQIKSCLSGNILYLSFQNPYNGMIKMSEGLPLTQKAEYGHGYGVKSIRHIAEKYGGYVTLKTDDNVFNLIIMFSV